MGQAGKMSNSNGNTSSIVSNPKSAKQLAFANSSIEQGQFKQSIMSSTTNKNFGNQNIETIKS